MRKCHTSLPKWSCGIELYTSISTYWYDSLIYGMRVSTYYGRVCRFKALDDPWCDTTTPQGELILTVMGGLAEFERKLIRARCEEGIKRAKAKGTKFGRPSVLDASERRKIAERYAAGEQKSSC